MDVLERQGTVSFLKKAYVLCSLLETEYDIYLKLGDWFWK
jgi:hypothetical protein